MLIYNNRGYRVYVTLDDSIGREPVEGTWYAESAEEAISCAQEWALDCGVEFDDSATWEAIEGYA